jgi:two-component system, NarL family, nitrate/nitrite response regulator NarL
MSLNGQPVTIHVLIITGIRLYREGLAQVLGAQPHIEVVGLTGDPLESLQRDPTLRPDVVLVDTSMPEAVAVVRAVLAAAPATKVIAMAVSEEDHNVLALAEAGVSGYVTRDAALGDLVTIIESAARGEAPCPPRLTATLLRHITVLATRTRTRPGEPRLTHRELEILELIDRGLSNKEIARRLCIEIPTVKNHVHRILNKLQLDRRAEAAAWARANEGHRLVHLRLDRLEI